jgi:hypothetical protein
MADKNLEVLRLTFKALPDEVPPAIRFRRLLKWALRGLRLKCIDMDNGPGGKPIAPDPDLDASRVEPPF